MTRRSPTKLDPERLAELAARLAQGYYDRDDVRMEIVRRLLAREYPT